jgi:hypothetical protein
MLDHFPPIIYGPFCFGDRMSNLILNRKVCKDNCLAILYPQIASEWHPTKNGKLTPYDFTRCSNKKVWWLCNKGHEWESQINSRTGLSSGCPCCANQKVCIDNCLATVHPEISKEWDYEKNSNITPHDVIGGSNKKRHWKCTKGHRWVMSPNKRYKNNKIVICPYCSNNKACIDNCLATMFPNIASEWHPTKNGESTPYDIVFGSCKKVWWKCKKGHEWKAVISSRTFNGSGCPYCCNQMACIDNCLTTLNPKIAKEWDYKKNGKLTPYDVTVGSNKKAWWKCSEEHSWQATINRRTGSQHSGCPYCANQKVCLDNCLATVRPDLSKDWHPTKNGKLTPYDFTSGSNKNAWWQCYICGDEWETSIQMRNDNIKKCLKCRSLGMLRPELASEWHPTKNGKLTPYDISVNSSIKPWWICKNKHEWQTSADHRSKGSSCPFCQGIILKDGTHCDSIVEALFYLQYKKARINFKHHGMYGGKMGKRKYDFYLIDDNKYVEVTSFGKNNCMNWNEYIKNINNKGKYVRKILKAKFEFIQLVPNAKQTKYVKANSKI